MQSLFFTAVAVLAALSGARSEEKVFLQRAGEAFRAREYRSILIVDNGERFGKWTWTEMCPDKFFAIGFSLRVQPYQEKGDDTAMNGIRLYCAQDDKRNFLYSVESHTGFFGDWSQPQYCPNGGVLTSFQLRVYPYGGQSDDNTSAGNLKFRCSSHPTLEGPGIAWGDYGGWSQECSQGGICGIQTKMEENQSSRDDTTLNDVRFHCCARP